MPGDEVSVQRGWLLARLGCRYELVEETLDLGHTSLRFVRVTNPDRVLDQVAAEEDRREREAGRRIPGDELHLPYWAQLWDSAIGMARWLGAATLPPGLSVLDLGCGMGLAGVAALSRGAKVLFADLDPSALLFARLNGLPWPRLARFRRVDWRRDQLAERFDLILGADILYEKSQWEPLELFWQRHLAAGGRVLLGEPGRQTGELFVTWIAGRGWKLSETAQAVPTRERPIRLFTLTRE